MVRGAGVRGGRHAERRQVRRAAEQGASSDMSAPSSLHLAVALDGAGWHPAAWREPEARPGELLRRATGST